MSTTVTSKGQVTIPKRVRDAAGLKPGSKVEFDYKPGIGLTLRPLGKPRKSDYQRRLNKVRGTLKTGLSTDELMKFLRGDSSSMVLVDTNVLLDVLQSDARWGNWSYAALDAIANSGDEASINSIIYAELSVYFERKELLDSAIESLKLVLRDIPVDGLFIAGKAFQRYRAAGGTKVNVLPDFFIGAHAAIEGATLLTRDPRRVRNYFPTVTLVSP